MDNQNALQPVRLQKARPRYGGRVADLQCPAWIEPQLRAQRKNHDYSEWVKESHRREKRAAAIEKVKTFIAGVVFVVMALATAVVR